MKQANNQNNMSSLNDMEKILSSDLNKEKNLILNLNNIIELISSGIVELAPLLDDINNILPDLIEFLGIPFCDLINETNLINYYFNLYITNKSDIIKNILISFIQVFNFISTDITLGDTLIQLLLSYDNIFNEILKTKRKTKTPVEEIYDILISTYKKSSLENRLKIKKDLLEKINQIEIKKIYSIATIQYLKEKIVAIDNNIRIIDINNIQNVNVFNGINNYINNFKTNNFFQLKNIYKNNVIVNEEINKVKNIPLKDREFLYKDEELIDEENEYTEYKHYSYPFSQEKVDEIKRQYCGFLNNHGGRIYLGINDLRIVKGIRLEPKENEIIKNELLNYTNDFYPPCSIDKINLYFIPVRHQKTNKVLHNLYVLKIIVMPGEPYNLYSIHNKGGYISTLRLPGQCINLTAEEIYSELMKRAELLKQKDINDINNQQKKINKNKENDELEEGKYDDITEDVNENDDEKKKLEPKEKNGKKNSIYVIKISNIDTNLKIKDINKYFTGCGCCLQKFPSIEGKSKGYGEIHFYKKAIAKSVMKKFNKNDLGGTKQISMKLIKRVLKEA